MGEDGMPPPPSLFDIPPPPHVLVADDEDAVPPPPFVIQGPIALPTEVYCALEWILGDYNNDGISNISDIVQLIPMITGGMTPMLSTCQMWACDADSDNNLDVFDVVIIINNIVSG